MSQTFNKRQPKFSRRQVTKRTFNLLGSPNVLQNVQPDKKTKGSTQKRKISESKQNEVVDHRNKQSSRGKGSKDSTKSSSHVALLKEQKENEASRDLNLVHSDSDKDEEETVHTPQKQQKLDGIDYSPALGDVSVSFLASTPKPGRPQLSRRRPMSPVTEPLVRPQVAQNDLQEMTESNFTDNHFFKQRKVNLLEDIIDRQEIGRESPRKRSPLKQASFKGSPQKRNGSPQKRIAGSSINEKIASINKSRLEKKRNNSDGSNKTSVNETSEKGSNLNQSKAGNKIVSEHEPKRGGKQQKLSVPVQNTSVSKTRLVQQNSRNFTDTDISDLPEIQTSMRNRNLKLTNKYSKTTNEANVLERPQTRGNISRTRLRNNVTSSETDVTVRDDTSRGSLTSQQRKFAVNRKLQSISRNMQVAGTSADNISSAVDQTMMVWETSGQKRSRSDLIDLDVVLNTVTETLEARMDVYDTDEEQSAARLLEKYLTNDITHMIQGVQTVTGLQVKIKKSRQSIKQKQKSLMALQKERIEKEEKCEPLKKVIQENENMTTINQFLKDLSKLIDKC